MVVASYARWTGRGYEFPVYEVNTSQEGDETMKLICDLAVLGAAAFVVYWTLLESLL